MLLTESHNMTLGKLWLAGNKMSAIRWRPHFLSLHQWSVSLIDNLVMELPTARMNKAGRDVLEAWKATLEAAKSPLTWKLTSCAIFTATEKMVGREIVLRGGGDRWGEDQRKRTGSRSRGLGWKINEEKQTRWWWEGKKGISFLGLGVFTFK